MIKSFNGIHPRIAATASVSEAAYILGDVEIGENSDVWPGAVIRGDFAGIKIGNNCRIEACCVVHGGSPISIGDGVHVGHGSIVHCSRIGNGTLVGMNATILDDVVIGDGCAVAAGAVVSRGTQVPDGCFVAGIPATVKGTVTEALLARDFP